MARTIRSISGIIEPYSNYPKVIKNAILMAEAHPALSNLTRAYRRVLKIIVSRAPKANACAPIELEQSWLADMAECSTRTVYRAVTEFKAMGLLEQVGDGRDDTGLFANPVYCLTPLVAGLLGFPPKSFSNRKTVASDDLIVELTVKEDQGVILDQKMRTPAGIALPAELDQLPEELGVSRPTIAKLRGEACAAGYDLAHVVACAKRYIVAKGVQAKRIPGYLRKMIATPGVDYAGRAAQEGRVAVQAGFEARATLAAKKHAGRAFVEPGGHTYRFRSDGSVEILDGGTMLGRLPMDQIEPLVERIERGEFAQPAAPAPAAPAAAPKSDVRGVLAGLRSLLRGGSAPQPSAA